MPRYPLLLLRVPFIRPIPLIIGLILITLCQTSCELLSKLNPFAEDSQPLANQTPASPIIGKSILLPTQSPSQTPDAKPSSTQAMWKDTHIPFPLPGGLTPNQADTILSLVSIAENSTTSWWDHYNYIEDIGDGRGYTLNIVGFCTGTGDFLWLVEDLQKFSPTHPLVKFLPALRAVNGSSSHVGLKGLPELIATLGTDPDYLRATWDAILYFYWTPAMDAANRLGLTTALSKGQLYDINLNAGTLNLTKKVRALPPSKGGNEKTWLAELQTLWLTHITVVDSSLNSSQPDRALMWNSLLSKGNFSLSRPLTELYCYGDKFELN